MTREPGRKQIKAMISGIFSVEHFGGQDLRFMRSPTGASVPPSLSAVDAFGEFFNGEVCGADTLR